MSASTYLDDDDIFTPPSSVTNLDDDDDELSSVSSVSTLGDLPSRSSAHVRSVALPDMDADGATFTAPVDTGAPACRTTPLPPPSDEELRALEAKIAALMGKLKTGTATVDDRRRMAELGARMESLAKSAVTEKMRTRTAMKTALRSKEKEVRFAERRKEIRSALKVYENAEKVNLLFMMDATGSMSGHIDAVKTQIQEIVANMRRSHAGIQLHVGFLAYRDHCDESSGTRFEVLPFTNDINRFQSFVGGLAATGGGDEAEDIHGALKVAGQQDWTTGGAATRVLIHIGDAPCHGSQYHNGCGDEYASGDPYSLQAVDLLKRLQGLQIEYTFGRINASTDKMIEVFNQEVGGEPYITTCEVQDTKRVTKIVTTSLRASIAKTASALRSTGTFGFGAAGSAASTRSMVSLRSYRIETSMPAWHTIAPRMVAVYSNKPVTMEQLQKRGFGFLSWGTVEPTDGTKKEAVRVKIAPHPFAEGELRLARYAQLITKGSTPHVLKEFKVIGDGVHTLERYLKQIEVSTISAYLAREYNKIRPPHCKQIRFLKSHAVSVDTARGKRFYNLERMLPAGTKFIKYSNNVGYWDDDEFDETLARFSQWTHEVTRGYMMVVDLQGVKTDKEYILTDPVLHCKDIDRFGSTNMGELGMDRCLKSLRAYI